MHLTETCEADWPELIVQVKTTLAPRPDVKETLDVQQELERRQWLPDEHLLDGGYLESTVLVKHPPHLRMIGPVPLDTSWQAQEGKGLDITHFQIDWSRHMLTGPQGQPSRSWRERPAREGQIQISFAKAVCQACPVRSDGTKADHREVQLQPQAAHEALRRQRAEPQTPAFRQAYALRSAVEATISQAVRRLPLRQSRYRGMPKVQLQQLMTATALNCLRLYDYVQGEPRGNTWVSHLTRLKRCREQLPSAA